MAANVEVEGLKEFADIGIPYVWIYSNSDSREQKVPEGHVFRERVAKDVMTTQLFMRWYFKALFGFTFKENEFSSDIKFFWKTWVVNRKNTYEKIVDALAIIVEVSLYCRKFKNFELTDIQGKDLFLSLFEDLKEEFVNNGGWEEIYKTATNYDLLNSYVKPSKDMCSDYEFEFPIDDSDLEIMKKSQLIFPIEKQNSQVDPNVITQSTSVFVRLTQEMCPYKKSYPFKQQMTYITRLKNGRKISYSIPPLDRKTEYIYFPQERKWQTECSEFTEPDEIVDEIVPTNTDNDINNWKNNFASQVLQLDEPVDKIYLLSLKYKNSLKDMLIKRYSGEPGNYYGGSGEPLIFEYQKEQFRPPKHKPELRDGPLYFDYHMPSFTIVTKTQPPDSEDLHWIEAAHLTLIWFRFK